MQPLESEEEQLVHDLIYYLDLLIPEEKSHLMQTGVRSNLAGTIFADRKKVHQSWGSYDCDLETCLLFSFILSRP